MNLDAAKVWKICQMIDQTFSHGVYKKAVRKIVCVLVFHYITVNDSTDMKITMDNSTKSGIKLDQSTCANHEICRFHISNMEVSQLLKT